MKQLYRYVGFPLQSEPDDLQDYDFSLWFENDDGLLDYDFRERYRHQTAHLIGHLITTDPYKAAFKPEKLRLMKQLKKQFELPNEQHVHEETSWRELEYLLNEAGYITYQSDTRFLIWVPGSITLPASILDTIDLSYPIINSIEGGK